MTEKPRVKKAPRGLSQKLSCSYQTWRATRRTSLSPRNDPVVGRDGLDGVGVDGAVGDQTATCETLTHDYND